MACGGGDGAPSTSSSEAASGESTTSAGEEATTASSEASSSGSEAESDSTDATSATDATSSSSEESSSTESTDTTSDSSTTGVMGCEGGPAIDVLWIGNSYTYGNDLPGLVEDIACSAGYVVQHQSATAGGYTFGSHLNDVNTHNAIASQAWDYVVLQNQSQIPGFPASQVMTQSLPNAVGLVDLIEANDPETQVLYFQTWGRRDGDQQNCAAHPPVCTFEGHTEQLAQGYGIYQAETGGTVVPVGYAWRDAVADPDATFDTQQLWSGDGSHATLHGSYLTAAAFFKALYGESPEGLAFPDSMPEADAAFLQGIAAAALP